MDGLEKKPNGRGVAGKPGITGQAAVASGSGMGELRCTPIGVVRSAYGKPAQAPRQPGVDDRREQAVIELAAGLNLEQAVEDLAGFERIWVVSWFNRVEGWKPKVRPPRGTGKRGVLATRSPHRPNPIGLSVARVVGVEGLRIRIAETDLLDGTPVLDIKPYIPAIDAFADSRTGWLEHLPAPLPVRWAALAREKAEWLRARGVDVIGPAERVLALGTEPHPYRRIARAGEAGRVTGVTGAGGAGGTSGGDEGDGVYELAVESWRVVFSVRVAGATGATDEAGAVAVGGECVEVLDVTSGYSAEAVAGGGAGLHQGEVHIAFGKRWEAKPA